ncbi:PilZ domain-containing protein [Shinella yambaruensis]|uniref:Pilus assembly protein PilZ n=1 Tax=Shinella yambaruensis TaxID=415996 RepID=A0ABQ5ZUB7_9HYPH|nr:MULTISPECIES: PilZ domain-containing protein [Shinella]CAI0337857.1 Pilus assembly protein PilZ [Rhizobiaceae bacterium]CAK7256329.1 Pilus assembly protein PilZ [Shinella sp. WSC3-e]MCJ8023835.1 PilZ domain-containing protein [Shinella yambaruensis]MCO5138261.1 PilZ domain-containing protein [Shinella sp.]MCU7979015.1 PilZ domain-containing protein [Shinella yambaruensis]
MYSFQQASPAARKPQPEQRSFQRVSVNLPGRLMLPNHDEYECTVLDMSPGDASFVCAARPRMGERIIAYVDHLGRIEGSVAVLNDNGFAILLTATDRKREKLAAQLTWIANKHELGLPEDRRHNRLAPRNTRTELTLDDGRRYPCRIIDLSLSGAAVDIEVRPALGTPIQLGNMKGRVVRHFQEGVAIEFSSVQSKEALTAFL